MTREIRGHDLRVQRKGHRHRLIDHHELARGLADQVRQVELTEETQPREIPGCRLCAIGRPMWPSPMKPTRGDASVVVWFVVMFTFWVGGRGERQPIAVGRWSRQGTKISYIKDSGAANGSTRRLFIMSADGSSKKPLTPSTMRVYGPSWGP